MNYWLLKTEPSEYSWEDLVRDRTVTWDGIANPTALIHLRAMSKGDQAIVYHTGGEKAAVGIAKVASPPRVDPAGDAKSCVVDLTPLKKLHRPVTLAQIKTDPAFKGWDLLRIGRLSVVPVPAAMWQRLLELSVKEPS